MNELNKTEFINALPKEVSKHYRKAFGFESKESLNYANFVPFCHAYSKELLNYGRYDEYGAFVEGYNRIIKEDEVYKFTEETQKELILYLSSNYEGVLIKDERYMVKSDEFKYEADLEKELVKQISDYFLDEMEIETQQVVGYGRCDILLNKRTAIELKKGKAKRKDVYQTFEYSFSDDVKDVCLIASEFSDDVIDIAGKLGVSCYEYGFVYGISGDRFVLNKNGDTYPTGMCLYEVSGKGGNDLDYFLSDNGAVIDFSNFDPEFHFGKEFEKTFKIVKKVIEKTKKVTGQSVAKHNKRAICKTDRSTINEM
jgi:hypothetical protein